MTAITRCLASHLFATSLTPMKTPSLPSILELLPSADAPAALASLGLAHNLVSLPRRTFPAWGLPHDALPQCVLHVASRPGLRVIAVTGDCSPAERRRVALAHHRVCLEPTLWIFATPAALIALHVDSPDGHEGLPALRTLDLPRRQPTPAELAAWEQLAAPHLCAPDLHDPAQALRRHLRDALDQDPLMRRFASGFHERFAELRDAMIDGPADPADRASIALQVLLRLLVLSLLQARGALNHDRSFLLRALRAARVEHRDLYLATLRPLCFGSINTPTHLRSPEALALGLLPFLNGGLFEPLPAELKHPRLTWPAACWDNTIEHFLAKFPFSTTGPDLHARAVDPEMLGKVFESLMAPDQRHRSGTFYTPRHVVRSIVEDALAHLLHERAQLPLDLATSLVQGAHPRLDSAQSEAASNALARLHILDPAVGTGAFLLEALAALRRCWRGLGDLQRADSWQGVRALIHDHLWGLDIEPVAARLCELRLWLALLETWPAHVEDIHALEPLPNLTHRIITGDSLLSPIEAARPSAALHAALAPVSLRAASSIAQAESRYLDAHGPEKTSARLKLHRAERAATLSVIDARRLDLTQRLQPLDALTSSRDLFGQPLVPLPSARALHADLSRELAHLDRLRTDLASSRTHAVVWESRLAPVLSRGGFDLIITNPPWVRAERVNPTSRKALHRLYTSASCQLWPDAASEGVAAHFGTQTDLAALFLERSLSWLKPGGHLAALVPAKLLRSLHGAPLRALLAQHHVRAIEDASDSATPMFDAVTYPAILHLRRRISDDEPAPNTAVTLWTGRAKRAWRSPLSSLWSRGRAPSEPWLLAPPDALAAFHHLRQRGPALGSTPALRPRRGVMTGCNDAFIIQPGQLPRVEHAWSRPVLCGRDLRPWAASPSSRILWPMSSDSCPVSPARLPKTLHHHFNQFAPQLQARADWHPEHPLWRIYRAQDGLSSHKVVWRDLGELLDAAPVGPEVIPLNTVYYIPCTDPLRAAALTAFLLSTPIRALARCLAERAHHGWRRHMAWVVASLPIPILLLDWLTHQAEDPTLEQLAQLALDGTPAPLITYIEGLMALSPLHLQALRSLLPQQDAA